MYQNVYIKKLKRDYEVHLWDDRGGYQKFIFKNYAFLKDPTGTYTSLITNDGGIATASGYYFGSSMLQSPKGANAILDESAANTFANAKNCAMSQTYGRGSPKVSIYKSTEDPGGETGGEASEGLGQFANGDKNYGTGLGSTNVFDSRRKL